MKPKKKSENTPETSDNENTSLHMRQKCSKREAHNDIGLPQETRKISNKQPNSPLKNIWGGNKIQSHQDEGSNKIKE